MSRPLPSLPYHDWAACCAYHWLLWTPHCLTPLHPTGIQAVVSHLGFKSLSAEMGAFDDCDPGASNGEQPTSSLAVLLMYALSGNPCPFQHSCCDFCEAVTDGRKPYAEVLPSLLLGRCLLVGRCKCSPMYCHWIFACVDWEIQSNGWCFRVMKPKINNMCFNYYLCYRNSLCIIMVYRWDVHAFHYVFLSVSFLFYWLLIWFGCLHLIVLHEGGKCVFVHSEEQTLQICIWRVGDMEMLEKFEELQQATCQCVLLKSLKYSLKKPHKLLYLAVLLSGCSSSVFWGCLTLSIPASPLALTMNKTREVEGGSSTPETGVSWG